MRRPKGYGYKRRALTPDPNNAKVCTNCKLWFIPRPREQRCDGCVTPSVRAARHAKHPTVAPYTRTPGSRGKRAAQSHRSDALGLTFSAKVPLWRVLAMELAAQEVWQDPRPRPRYGLYACEPDCGCDACKASRPIEYKGVLA